jgi:nucleotide-binding universal stress UspA family protein
MTPPKLSRVWQRDELEGELKDALELVEALSPPDDLRVAVFNMAANALLQRVVEQQPTAVAIGGLGRSLGRG